MKHFITFQKLRGLNVSRGGSCNSEISKKIEVELFKYGFVLTPELSDILTSLRSDELADIYSDLCKGLTEIYGSGGYEPIYQNFPQSVKDLSYEEFVINAIIHYQTFGQWRPSDVSNREFKIEPASFKPIRLITGEEFNSIFTDLVYSNTSLSKFDKIVVDWFCTTAIDIKFNQIQFAETRAYIGKKYLEFANKLPTNRATDVLRIYAAFSGGDEGLKSNTRFKQPTSAQKRVLLSALENCVDLEESFKMYREPWLRAIYYLNPGSKENRRLYPELAAMVDRLRNSPKSLRTFNSRVEEAIKLKDVTIFDLLVKRKGVFLRRINELYNIFGDTTIDRFIETKPSLNQLIQLYNYFNTRRKSQTRSTILAGQGNSSVATYGSIEALPEDVVFRIQRRLLDLIVQRKSNKKIHIADRLYRSPIVMNNRASNLSIGGNSTGTIEQIPFDSKVIRCYVHWVDRYDIDLSAMVITNKNTITKVGWNGRHSSMSAAIVYSGDNTGYAYKNAEYIDIDLKKLDSTVEWIIVDANVYRGPNYSKWPGAGVHVGWMLREYPEANNHWLPDTVANAVKLQSDTGSAYLLAIHVPTMSLIYLDVSSRESNVTSGSDAVKMRDFLQKFIDDSNSDGINWNKLNQGHILHLLGNVVESADQADIVFDEHTPWEKISAIITSEQI